MAIVPGTRGDDNLLKIYFDNIADSIPLSRKEEVALAEKIQSGDTDARNELVQANLRFVISIAKEYQNHGLNLIELISAGNMGLITAAERFDVARGFKFISYAVWWIRQSILQSIAEQARTVRLPLNKLNLLRDISEMSRKLRQKREGVEPWLEEIAEELDKSVEEVKETILSARIARSLDETFEEQGDDRTLFNLMERDSPCPDEDIIQEDIAAFIDILLSCLDSRERRIIVLYYGFESRVLPLEEIGQVIGVTRERTRQLRDMALARLRHPSRWEIIEELCQSMDFPMNKKFLENTLKASSSESHGSPSPEERLIASIRRSLGRELTVKHIHNLLDIYETRHDPQHAQAFRAHLEGASCEEIEVRFPDFRPGEFKSIRARIIGWLCTPKRLKELGIASSKSKGTRVRRPKAG